MENSDGLFTIKCKCETVFSPEITRECPSCNLISGDLILDIDKFYDKIYGLGKTDAIDVIFDVFHNLWNRYDIMNDILEKADTSKMSGGVMCSFLTNTFKYSEQVPNHKVFFQKVHDEYVKRGETPERIKRILVGLEGAGNHWETMEKLGATGWIWGPNPNK